MCIEIMHVALVFTLFRIVASFVRKVIPYPGGHFSIDEHANDYLNQFHFGFNVFSFLLFFFVGEVWKGEAVYGKSTGSHYNSENLLLK